MMWAAGLATATLLILYSFALTLPDLFGATATKIILFALVLCVGALLARMASGFVVAEASRKRDRPVPQLIVLLVGILFFLPVLAGAFYVVLEANLAALVTTSALLTAVSGFALQATLGNLFEGLAIQIDHPFKIGDLVRYNAISGVVEGMSWRAVRIRDVEGWLHVIPNNALAKDAIRVAARGEIVQIDVAFSLPAEIEPARIVRLAEAAAATATNVVAQPPPQCRITGFQVVPVSVSYMTTVSIAARSVDPVVLQSRVYARILHALARDEVLLGSGGDNTTKTSARPAFLVAPGERDEARDFAMRTAFADLDESARSALLADVRLHKYEGGERLPLTNGDDPVAYVVIRGVVSATLRANDSTVTDAPGLWGHEKLDPIIAEFTRCIGPAGPALVARIAPETTCIGDLYDRLSVLVPDSAARTAFLAGRPSEATVAFGPGTTLNFAAIFSETGSGIDVAVCSPETSVLAIDAQAVLAVLGTRPGDGAPLPGFVTTELDRRAGPRKPAPQAK